MVGISQWSGDVLLDSSDTCFGTPGSLDHNDGEQRLRLYVGRMGPFMKRFLRSERPDVKVVFNNRLRFVLLYFVFVLARGRHQLCINM